MSVHDSKGATLQEEVYLFALQANLVLVKLMKITVPSSGRIKVFLIRTRAEQVEMSAGPRGTASTVK